MPDSIPRNDAGSDTWQTNFKTYVNANLAALGLSAMPLDTDVAVMHTTQRLRTIGFADEGTPTSMANQTAHFIGRWMSSRNEPGQLSETASTTVPG
jgi:hypothetical protein